MPPGYFSLSCPPVLSVRQYGFFPRVSSAACAAIQAKIPVVIGHAMFTSCFFARAARSSAIVTNFPFGTRFINSSTSSGLGITIVPVPQRVLILPSTRPIFGKSFAPQSFSCQVRFAFICNQRLPCLLRKVLQLFEAPAQDALSRFPAHARIGNGNAVAKLIQIFRNRLRTLKQVALDH